MIKSATENAKKSFLSGVAFLFISAISVKLIGLFYKIPLVRLVGIEGMAYFSKYMTGKTQSLHDAFYQNMADSKLCLTVNDRNMLALIFEQRTFDLDHVLNISNTCNVVANVAKGTSTSLPSSLATIQVKMTDPDEKINPLKIFLNEMNSKY